MNSCAKEFEGFADLDKCEQIIENVLNYKDGHEKLIEEFKKIIQIYSQQPQFLDPHIGSLISKLTSGLPQLAELDSTRYNAVFKILYELVVVSGFKNVSQRFPHETDKLPMVVGLLSKENPTDKCHWETRYVLTVWLSILVLAPFDLKKFDCHNDQDSISKRIYTLLMRNLALHDSCQQVTSYCLSRYFSRSDILAANDYIDKFFNEALEEIKNTKIGSANSSDDIKLIGVLRTLGYMYEFLPRSEIKSRSPMLLETISGLDLVKIDRILVNHLMIKVVQRAGLSLLPARLAAWRYKRATRFLGTLKDFSDGMRLLESNLTQQQISVLQISDQSDEDQRINYHEEQESIQYIETILSTLFMAAQNAQTRIRWSAAKGIARAASRLSMERSGDIIDMVTNGFFKPQCNECAWHGGCLILAEMSRHGLILEEKLDCVINIVKDAIVFDKIKGSTATGAHIREAACYICWAMSRTYEDQILKPYISALSANLLCDMLFDKELQCRRAASAAFQELIGRQGAFSQDEISLLTDLDYHNVGQRQFAYLHLAPLVAKRGDKYVEPFVEHLMELKVAHWDIEIRRLSSRSLSALMLYYPQAKIKTFILPRLVDMCSQNEDNNMKHGGILTLASIMEGLVSLDYKYEQQVVDVIGSLADGCDKQLKSKLNAPKFIEAICSLVKSSEKANLEFDPDSKTIKSWESIVMSSLDSDSADLRQIGADAFLSLYRAHYKSSKSQQDRLLTILNKTLQSENESSRCGALLALSRLSQVPSVLLGGDGEGSGSIRRDADIVDVVLMSLSGYISKETHEKERRLCFPKAKAQSCESLTEFIRHLDETSLLASNNLLQAGYDALLKKAEDYTFDNRGDIGVIVRQAAIRALEEVTLLLLSRGRKCLLTKERVVSLMSKIVQQAIAYHDSCREVAGKCFYRLLASEDMPEGLIPQKERILELFKRFDVDDSFEWRHQSTPIFINLLPKKEYSCDVWKGLISGVGQLSELGGRQFKIALSDFLRSLDDGVDDSNRHHHQHFNDSIESDRKQVFESLMETVESIGPSERSLKPALNLLDHLLTEGLLDESICASRLCNFCWNLRETTDVKRLMALVRILASLMQFNDGTQIQALDHCSSLLKSGYAKVREFVAEQLYTSLVTYESDMDPRLHKRISDMLQL